MQDHLGGGSRGPVMTHVSSYHSSEHILLNCCKCMSRRTVFVTEKQSNRGKNLKFAGLKYNVDANLQQLSV